MTKARYKTNVTCDVREHAAALAVRAWIEPGATDGGLRARITSTVDLEMRDEQVMVAFQREEIVGEVSRWLERFLATSSS